MSDDDDMFGHNSGDERLPSRASKKKKAEPEDGGALNTTKEQLKSLIGRIERLADEKKAVADDIKEVFAEAKANGFDTKVLRKVLIIKAQDAAERQEFDEILRAYCDALGIPL